LHPDQVIGRQIVAEPVALLHDRPQIPGVDMECQGRRVACAGDVGRLVRTIGVEALDRRLGLGLDAEIARRTDTDEQRPGLRVDHQMAVLVAGDDPEHALLGEHRRAIGAGHRLALLRR
jgi:hypothetical protein